MSRFTKIIPLLLLLSLLSPAVARFPVQRALPLHSEVSSAEREHRQPAEASKLSPADTPPPVGEQVVIERVTYTLDDQSVAVHVTGHPDESQNGIFYIHTDHLGSRTVQTDRATGQAVAGSKTRFYPFGSYRQAPTEPLTGRGYTGHQHNDDLGLIYMNARYYVPGIGRFASADTIVPDPTNPQSFNRYSYVLNNPLKYQDPTGHCWSFASGMRGWTTLGYDTTCANMDMAWNIATHPDATAGQKLMAGSYMAAEGLAHAGVVAGAGAATVGCVTATSGVCGGAAIANTVGGAGTAACSDGDCTNEVAAVANSTSNAARIITADGDPTNELRAALQPAANFANRVRSMEHFLKHVRGLVHKAGRWNQNARGIDMPEFQNFSSYNNAARSFLVGQKPAQGVFQVTRTNGDMVRFNPQTGYFGVKSADNTIRTFFRPQGTPLEQWRYFLEQANR